MRTIGGIGGTAKDPAVVAAQKAAMKRYRRVEDLYKRGEFFGINEEIHVHVSGSRVAVNAYDLPTMRRYRTGCLRTSAFSGRMSARWVGRRLERRMFTCIVRFLSILRR